MEKKKTKEKNRKNTKNRGATPKRWQTLKSWLTPGEYTIFLNLYSKLIFYV